MYRACRRKENIYGISGCTVNRETCHVFNVKHGIWEKNTVHGKSGDTVNWDTVNRKMTVKCKYYKLLKQLVGDE